MSRPETSWPQAALDDVARLHVLAAALPGVAVHERHIDHPFEEVWGAVTDFEGSVPIWEPDVAAIRVRRRDGERIDLVAKGSWWLGGRWVGFDVDVRPGWCWMVARRPRLYVIGMAAEPDGAGTRFAHLEGVVLPSPRWARLLVRPLLWVSHLRHRRHVPHDVDGIVRELDRRRL